MSLSPDELGAAKVAALEHQRRAAAKFKQFFSDDGAYARDQYLKHLEFFAAGARYKERLFMAANRVGKCCTIDSLIECEDGPRTIRQMRASLRPLRVWAWDGARPVLARVRRPWKKGIEPCYRITMADGQRIECAREHRILTSAGWRFVGDLLPVFPARPVSIAAPVPPDRPVGARRSSGRLADWLGRCFRGFRRYGGPLPTVPSIDRARLPRPADVPPPGAVSSRGDDPVDTDTSSGQFSLGLPPNWDDYRQRGGLFVAWATQTVDTTAGLSFCSAPGHFQSAVVYDPRQFGQPRPPRVDETFGDGRPSAWLNTSNRIISIEAIGDHDVYDFEVETHHCYLAAGLIHHNSEAGAYEVTCHLTGRYPAWWTGRRFEHPVEVWASGTNSQTTRDIVQAKLLGPVGRIGDGMVPHHLIAATIVARGLPGALEGARVKHVSGGESLLGLKSYEQGRQSFEGTAKHVIWDDEEPPADVYTEQLYRTVTTKGIALVTFTPLQGMSDVVKGFLEPETDASKDFKWYVQAGWKDVPHLDEDEKRALRATTPPYQIQARTEGEPVLGSGAIYPIAEADVLTATRLIPDTWRRVYALDVGWNRTAALWGAEEPGTGNIELYAEHYQGQGEPASHAQAIKSRGEWIVGVMDPAGLGSSQIDGRTLMDMYGKLGLKLQPAINAVEAGLTETWNLLVSGRLKVQEHLHNWRSEFRKYHRDEKGKIVKANDHLMDCTRYLVVSGRPLFRVAPKPRSADTIPRATGPDAWMS